MDLNKAYQILGLKYGAGPEAAKARYKQLQKEWHPDNHPEEEERYQSLFQALTEAYDTIAGARTIVPGDMMKPATPQGTTGAKIIGKPLTYHPGSQERRSDRQRFENRHQEEALKRREKMQQEMRQRQAQMQEKKAKDQKTQEVLNEIRMIRLAHIIEDIMSRDGGKAGTE